MDILGEDSGDRDHIQDHLDLDSLERRLIESHCVYIWIDRLVIIHDTIFVIKYLHSACCCEKTGREMWLAN